MSFKRSDGSDALRLYALSNGSRHSRDSVLSQQPPFDDNASIAESVVAPLPEPKLPDLDLPQATLDLSVTFDSILAAIDTSPEPE
jgi:hypothetical protein